MNVKHPELKHAAAIALAVIALLPAVARAADYFSTTDGTWNSAGRWRYGVGASCAGGGSLSTALIYPGSAASGAADNVTICTGDDITLPLSPANPIVSLTKLGTGSLASSTGNVTLTVNGDVINSGLISFNGLSGAFTLDINGNLTNTGTISVSANDRVHTFSVSGNITSNGGIDLRNGSNLRIANLTLDGAGTQTLSGTGTIEFYTVTAADPGHEFEINKGAGTVSVGSNMSLAGDLTITAGTLSISGASGAAQTIDVGGDISNAGTVSIANVTLTHIMNLGGNLTNTGTFDMAFDANSRCQVNFLGSTITNPVVSGAGTLDFNIIGVNLSGATTANMVDLTSVFTLNGNNSGFAFTDGTLRISSASNITPAAQITIPANAQLTVNHAGAVLTTNQTLIINGGILNIADAGGGNGGDVNVGNAANENVQINNIATSELRIAAGTLDVAGRVASAVAVGGDGVFDMSGGTITVGINGNTLNAQNGAPFALGSATSFTQSGGTIVIRAANTQANAREYDVQSAVFNVTGGTLQIGDGSTGAGQTFQINSAAPVYNLTLNAANTPTTTLFAPLDVHNDLTIGAGTTLNLSANQAIDMGNGTAGGDWINNGGTFTPGTGTVTFNGTGPQDLGGTGPTTFANLTDANTGAVLTASTDIDVGTALTVNAGAVFQPAAAVVINNAAAAGTISGSGTIHVTRVAATADYSNQYKFSTNTLSSLTVNYSGAGAQTVNAFTYGTLIASNSGTKTLEGNVTINNDLSVSSSGVSLDLTTFTADRAAAGGTLTVVDGATLRIGGTNGFPANYSSVALGTASTVDYYGSTQTVGGHNYGHLTIDGSGTKTLAANADVNGTLNLNAGLLATGANQLFITSTGSVSRGGGCGGTNCFVVGNLVKHVATGSPTIAWEVGTETPSPAYAPVSLSFTGAVAGNFQVTTPTAAADHPDVTANLAGIAPTLSVNRYWTFTRLTGSAASYDATFNYGNVAGDVDFAASPANFIIGQKGGGFWEYPTVSGTPTATSATAIGIIDASGDDFAIGEALLSPVLLSQWRMNQFAWDGTANEVVDSGSGGYHGTADGLSTKPTTDSTIPAIAGSPGTCQYGVFDRANKDYVALPSAYPNLSAAAGGFTVAAWIRATNVGDTGQRIMVDDETNANGNWGFSLGDAGAGRLRFYYRQAATFTLDTPGGSPLADDTWYFVAVAVRLKASGNSSKAEIFVYDTSGTLVTSAKSNFSVTSFATDATPPSIGGETNASGEGTSAYGFDGSIDMVSVFQTDLSKNHVNTLRQVTHACVFLDHIRIEHDGLGLTCAPETVTVKACTDSTCSSTYAGAVSTTLSPTGWVGGDSIAFSGGSTTADLRQTTAGTVTLGAGSTTPPPSNATRCFIGAVETCSMEFKDSGFIFDVPNLTACKTSASVTMTAVRTDLTSQTCAPAFTGSRDVDFWSGYSSPATGTQNVQVNGADVDNDGAAPGTSVSLNFDVNAQATFTVRYPDAGQMMLNARFTGSGSEAGLVMDGNDMFVASPVGLDVHASTSCGAGDSSCPVFAKAGATFPLTVQAACWTADGDTDLSDNPLTENFQMAGIPVTHTLISPAAGTAGSLGVTSVSFGAADAGDVILDQSVSEVGVFTFTVTPAAGGYFGLTVPAATSPKIGRFTPHRLGIASNTPLFAHSCDSTGDDFTYMDQPFYYGTAPVLTVTGLNAVGGTTMNYGGEGTGADDFWRMASTLSGRSYADPGHAVSFGAITNGNASLGGAADYDGQGTLTLPGSTSGDEFMYARTATPEAPFNAQVDMTFSNATLTDSDNICYDPDNDGCEPSDTFNIDNITGSGIGTAQQRFGRLVIGTAAGSELLSLAVRMEAEYFNGTAFTLNVDDTASCTGVAAAQLGLSGTGCAIGATTASIAHNPLLAGRAGLSFSAPGAACTGDVDVTVDLSTATGVDLEWLRFDWDGDGDMADAADDPHGRASFGVFGGNQNLIYIREPW